MTERTKLVTREQRLAETSVVCAGLQCLDCGEIVVSLHRHDWRSCKCGKVFIDGGRDYVRYGGDAQNMKHVTVRLSRGCRT
jgi:hypothetical protein